jgi:hypothetical protein
MHGMWCSACAPGNTGGAGKGPRKRPQFTWDQLYGMGLHRFDGRREISGASHISTINVKPCAGLLKTGWLFMQYRVKIYL